MSNLIGHSLGRYHILEQLGVGGMATVYKAYDTRLERDVAVKIIRRKAFPEEQLERILKRFEREAKALAKLSHPNIVHVHDYGEHEGAPYLVMEYLPGGTLKQRLGQPMPWQEAVRILLPIAQALEYAHEHNIVHRDIKPANILLTEKGQPMLSDFGIAKILDSEDTATLTGTGVGVGTPEYMAPEQWTGTAGPHADLYSLGVVLYELVTGRKPYTADTPAAVLLKQASDPLPRPGKFVPDLPDGVEKLLLKALAKRPEDRYPDMAALVKAMETLLTSHARSDASSADYQTLVQVEDAQATRNQDATRDEIPPAHSAPVGKVAILPNHPSEKKRSWWPWAFGIGGGILVVLAGIILLALRGSRNLGMARPDGELVPTVTLPMMQTPTKTIIPKHTPLSNPPLTPSKTPLPTINFLNPKIGSTWIRPVDGMVMLYIPEGNFKMGGITYQDELPAHTIYLDAFWIDQTEVTNAKYALCVQAGTCQPPNNTSSYTHSSYYNNSQYADYPVIYVSWYTAQAYCGWAGGRLPTEAEWEKAAHGSTGSIYPWGNDNPTCSLVNYWTCVGDTRTVGHYLSGASPYGVLDMAGNVWEWVNDWYDNQYYGQSPERNPQGPTSGDSRVLRGGSWDLYVKMVYSWLRFFEDPTYTDYNIGFRCARGTNP